MAMRELNEVWRVTLDEIRMYTSRWERMHTHHTNYDRRRRARRRGNRGRS